MSYADFNAANETYVGNSLQVGLGFNQNRRPIDWTILLSAFALIGFGLLMIYSATVAMRGHYEGFYYLQRQLIAFTISMLAMTVFMQLPAKTLRIISRYSILLAIFMLVLVLVPGVGRGIKGATRWIGFAGFNFQPAELAKVSIILYIADYIARRPDAIRGSFFSQWPIIVIVSIVAILLSRQPDHGSIFIIAIVVFTMLFIGGMKYWVASLLFFGGGLAAGIYLKWLAPAYAVKRLFSFLDPFLDPTASGYQLTHSLIAYGRGQFSGVGLGESIEKMRYLPEVHNDFILALIGEETGFIGVVFVLILFSVLLIRGFIVAKGAIYRNDLFGALAVYGICLAIGAQVVMNAAVTMAIFPTKGITLPFISYGSSSLIALGVALGVLFNVQRQKTVLNIVN